MDGRARGLKKLTYVQTYTLAKLHYSHYYKNIATTPSKNVFTELENRITNTATNIVDSMAILESLIYSRVHGPVRNPRRMNDGVRAED